MGRKIPGRKHRGVKDPHAQNALRIKNLAGKINAPPTNPDDQGIPKSLLRVMDLTQRVKDGRIPLKTKKKKKVKNAIVTSAPPSFKPVKRPGKPEKAVPVFTQYPGESGRTFLTRVNHMVQTVLKENEFEQKYQVDVQRNSITGEVEGVTKKPKDEIDELMKRAQNPRKKKKKKAGQEEKPRLSKSQKRKAKLDTKKLNKQQDRRDEFGDFKDIIKFGDVAHAPPELKRLPRKAVKLDAKTRPGRKDLLLSSMLPSRSLSTVDEVSNVTTTSVGKSNKSSVGALDRTGKRKVLPEAVQIQLERQRVDAVNAYKRIKASKAQSVL